MALIAPRPEIEYFNNDTVRRVSCYSVDGGSIIETRYERIGGMFFENRPGANNGNGRSRVYLPSLPRDVRVVFEAGDRDGVNALREVSKWRDLN